MEHPEMVSIIMDILFFLILAGVLIGVILFRWYKASENEEDKEKALDHVLWDLIHEPIWNLKEFRDNIKKDFKK